MDQLQQLVETLRVLARTNEPNRVALVEKAIDEYLNDKAGIARLSLERGRSLFRHSPRSNRRIRGAAATARDLPVSAICGRRRSAQLRIQLHRSVPTSRAVCCEDTWRHEARSFAMLSVATLETISNAPTAALNNALWWWKCALLPGWWCFQHAENHWCNSARNYRRVGNRGRLL